MKKAVVYVALFALLLFIDRRDKLRMAALSAGGVYSMLKIPNLYFVKGRKTI